MEIEILAKQELESKIQNEIEEKYYEIEEEEDNETMEIDEANRNIIWQPKDITIREFLVMKQD
jgi:hypothetical protein